jgi:hypothetical protein
MYKTLLVEHEIKDGRKLLEQLDARRFPVSAALWAYSPETNRWRLVIVSSVADTQGPFKGYTRIQRALGEIETILSLDDIRLVGKEDTEFRDLKRALGPPWPKSLCERRRPPRPFEDEYVYRWVR